MEKPFNGKVCDRLIYKRYKDYVFYYVSGVKGTSLFEVSPCVLAYKYDCLGLKMFDKNWRISESTQGFCWENLFMSLSEAKSVASKRNKLISSFKHSPYLSIKTIEEHFDVLYKTECLINKMLGCFENYNGIDFCDVSANGIQVRLHHKQIKGYTYGNQMTINYDFSNIEDIPYMVVKEFIQKDKPDLIKKELSFILDCEKYGWD